MPSEASADGWAYVDFLSRWRDKKVPFRLIVLDSKGAARLNMPVTVDSFDVTVRKTAIWSTALPSQNTSLSNEEVRRWRQDMSMTTS